MDVSRQDVVGYDGARGKVVQIEAVIGITERVGGDCDRAVSDPDAIREVIAERQVADDNVGIIGECLVDAGAVPEQSRERHGGRIHGRVSFDREGEHAGVNGARRGARLIVDARRQAHRVVLREGRFVVIEVVQSLVQVSKRFGGLDNSHTVRGGRPAGQRGRFRGFRCIAIGAEIDAAPVGSGLVGEGFRRVAFVNRGGQGGIRGHETLGCRVPPAQGRFHVQVQGRRGLCGIIHRIDGNRVRFLAGVELPVNHRGSVVSPQADALAIGSLIMDVVVVHGRSGLAVTVVKGDPKEPVLSKLACVEDIVIEYRRAAGRVVQVYSGITVVIGVPHDVVERDPEVGRRVKVNPVSRLVIDFREDAVVVKERAGLGV